MKRLLWVIIAVVSAVAQAADHPNIDGKQISKAGASTTVAQAAASDSPTSSIGSNKPSETHPMRSIDSGAADIRQAQEATNSRWTMIFTGCSALIGALQLCLFFWQLRLMRASMKDTAESAGAAMAAAKAAELNARAAIGMELPVLAIRPPDLLATDGLIGNEPYGGYVNDGPPTTTSAVGGFRVANHGRTPAFPTYFSAGWAIAPELPAVPTYAHAARLNHAAIVRPGEDLYIDEHYGIPLTAEEVASATDGTHFLWFYGCLRYRDFLGQERNHRFCWRFANRETEGTTYYFASDGDPPAAFIQSD